MQNLYEITGYDKCYLWSRRVASNETLGIITTKKVPSQITLSDIIGEYIIDGVGVDNYVGLDNMRDVDREGWVSILNTSSEDELRLMWRDQDNYGNTGVESFYFVGEIIDDDYCLTFNEFKNIWYSKSGYNQSFHPTNFGADMFSDIGLWTQLDSYNRMLWNDEYGSNYIYYSDMVYPISNVTGGDDEIYIYKRDNLSKNQLIRYKDIPNFALFNLKIEGLILHPTFYPNANRIRLQYVMPNGNGYYDIISTSEEIDTDHEIVDTYDNIYYTDLDYSSDKNKPESMYLTLIGNFYRRFSEDNSMNTPINVTFANGYTYPFDVTSETHDDGETVGSYRVILNGEWRSSSQPNPNSSLYEGVYESYSNYHSPNREAIMYIYVKGYSTFTIYIRSYAETTYDYVMVSQLDTIISGSTSTGVNVKAHTCGLQLYGTTIANYLKVVYDIPNDGYEHRIQIVYRKNSGVDAGDDRGYLLIQKSNPNAPASEYISNTISARCDNTENFSLSQIGTVTAIDYSNLYFSEISSAPSGRLGYIYPKNYWIATATNTPNTSNNYIFFNDSSIKPDSDFTCAIISLYGQILKSNVSGTFSGSGSNAVITIAIDSSMYSYGECYVRVPYKRNGAIQYICFRVNIRDIDFDNICNNVGDCTLWLQNASDYRIYMNNSTSSSIAMYPVHGDYTTGGRLVGGYLYDTFAHCHFNSTATSYYQLRYEYESGTGYSTESEIYLDDMVSLISPECMFLSDIWDYMQGEPTIWVSKHE
jgi:hypothetical protein